jgi:hypothetical protein
MSGGCAYIMTNRPNGIPYTGVIRQRHLNTLCSRRDSQVITDALLNPSAEDLRKTDKRTQHHLSFLSAKTGK